MFSTKVHQWNSVDISDVEDGLHHSHTRGIVVDKTETGLLVDFGVANQEPQLIAFDRIIDDDKPTVQKVEYRDGYEVLLQLSADEPWTWYPAEKLGDSKAWNSFSFALVIATVSDGRRITDVVRKMQIRCWIKHRSAVRFSDYLKEFVSVPYDDFVVTRLFRNLWIEETYLARTHPVGIVNNKFYYIQRRYDRSLDPLTVVRFMEEIMSKSAANNRGLKRSHEDSAKEDTLHQIELAFGNIPYTVLHGVFSHLDVVELVRYRRVCSLWDSIITTVDSTKVVIYDMSNCKNQDTYVLASVLFKFIKVTTMYLIFTGLAKEILSRSSRFQKYMEAIKMILDHTGITIPTLVLADLEIDRCGLLAQSNYSDDSIPTLSTAFHSICQRLVLVRVALIELFGYVDYTREDCPAYGSLNVPYATIRTVNADQWVLRDALEPSARQLLNSGGKTDMEHLRDWISEVSEIVADDTVLSSGSIQWELRENALFHEKDILRVLRTWEADDSRFGLVFTWKEVEAAQLSDKLDTLHSITVMCLLHRMEDARFEAEEDDSANNDSDEY